MFFKKSQKRMLISLNLVALIDISAMIIIFLIMGTIFGETSVNVPNSLRLPKSLNKETVEVAPQVIVHSGVVNADFLKQKIPLDQFLGDKEPGDAHERAVQSYIQAIPVDQKRSGVLLNFLADENTPYEHIFQVIRFYRKAGFQSVLFIAQGK